MLPEPLLQEIICLYFLADYKKYLLEGSEEYENTTSKSVIYLL